MSGCYTIQAILDGVSGRVSGDLDATQVILAIQTLADAKAGELSFLSNAHYKHALQHTKATAVFVAESVCDGLEAPCPLIVVRDPYLAYTQVQRMFFPDAVATGVRHPSAVVDASAEIAADVNIGAGCVIDAECVIGAGTVISAGCIIASGVRIGEHCLLHAGVKIESDCQLGSRVIVQAGAVIGSDGFGYAWTGKSYLKIPQVGRVVIHDDVEVGANTCIDRGALGDTVIHQGVKLDNLVHIAHNVEIGALSALAAQVGISGSSKIGRGCQLGGQVGVAGHLTVTDGCQLAGKAGVISDIDQAGVYSGFPAMPHRQWLKISALLLKLPEIWKKIK